MRLPRRVEQLADAATVVAAVAVVIITADALFARYGGRESQGPFPQDDRTVEDWVELKAQGQRMGPADARVEILEFGDYECPFCRRSERVLNAIRAAYPDDVAVVYRHYPLPQHKNAYHAAVLAECAGEQDRFEAVHDVLYAAITLADLDVQAIAEAADVRDVESFLDCVASDSPAARIEADIEAAKRVGVRGTPTIIVQGVLLAAPPDSATMFDLVRSHLERS